MRKHLVIGLGNFGMALAMELAQAGERVTAIDSNPDRARDAQTFVDQALVADGTDREALVAAAAGKVDVATVSLGGRTDAAALVVYHLTCLETREILAKALNEEHAEILRRIGATRVIYPEKEMAKRTAERLASRNVLDYLAISGGFRLVELAPAAPLVGKSLLEIDLGRKYGVQVLAIKEVVPERIILTPTPDHVIKDSDILVVMGDEEAIRKLRGL